MNKCLYCGQEEERSALMVPVCELDYSIVYFVKNQNFPGRCVVAFKGHKEELFQLTDEEQAGYMSNIARVSKAIYEIYKPDKLNYAIYGDGVPHVHCHIVPKKKDGFCWGKPFVLDGNNNVLSDEEAAKLAEQIKNKLLG